MKEEIRRKINWSNVFILTLMVVLGVLIGIFGTLYMFRKNGVI